MNPGNQPPNQPETPAAPVDLRYEQPDNPYLPRSQQNIHLALDPEDLAFLHPLPTFPPTAHAPAMLAAGSLNEQKTAHSADDVDDNSSVELVPLEDDDFPTYFRQIGSPPRLFHAHGSYVLPVDSNEIKVCYNPLRART